MLEKINRDKLGLAMILAGIFTVFSMSVYAGQLCQSNSIPAAAPDSRYHVQSKEIVVDKNTGLMWRTCVEGLNGESCNSGSSTAFTWAGALLYAAKINAEGGLAGYKDWRLPNIRELSTLVEMQCVEPSVNVRIFPNTPSSHVWTSSPYHSLTFYSWYVDFSTGETNSDDRVNKKNIRLVRDAN